jgi:carbonic anhydrase
MKILSTSSRNYFGALLASLALIAPASAYTPPGTQKALSPQAAFDELLAGNARFVGGTSRHRDLSNEVRLASTGQYPFATVLTCLDSRTAVEFMFDQGIGDVFVGRVAGNFANTDLIGSFEFSHRLAGSKVLVVVGHTACGAVKGACDGAELGNLTATLANIQPAVESVPADVTPRTASNARFVQMVADANVRLTVARILEESEVLRTMVEAGELGIIGGMYDLATGKVTFFPDTAHNLTLPEV